VVFAIAMGVLVITLLVLIVLMATPPKPRLRVGESPADHGAQAWIEDHDIDEMIEARNDRRRRLGLPEIGDDLSAELQRDLRRGR
jgi:hypothetical protein